MKKIFENKAGEKVKHIINEEFDERMSMTVITYLMEKGTDNLREITEEEILELKGNSIMTDDFVRALVRCAVRISKECNEIHDILPFIVKELYIPNTITGVVDLCRDEVNEDVWNDLIDDVFRIDAAEAKEIEMITLDANLLTVYAKED